MRRKVNKEEYIKLGITAVRHNNYWEILLNGRQAMIGLSDKDFELLRQKPVEEMMNILTYI